MTSRITLAEALRGLLATVEEEDDDALQCYVSVAAVERAQAVLDRYDGKAPEVAPVAKAPREKRGRPIKFEAGQPWPEYIDPYLLVSGMGQNLIHLTRTYPNEHASLCGRVTRGNAYDRGPDVTEDFARALCRECADAATRAAAAAKVTS